MAGYSGNPLPQKLGINPGIIVLAIDAPENYRKLLGQIPSGVNFATRPTGNTKFVHLFATRRRRLLYFLLSRRQYALGIFRYYRRYEPSAERNPNRVLGRHAQKSRRGREIGARGGRQKFGRSGNLRGVQSRLLRILLRRSRWQQIGNLLPRKSDRCRVSKFDEESRMSDPAHVPAILQEKRRVRYLKIIALFKIFKGALLFLLGFSLLFVNGRPVWLDQISDWADDQLLLHHSKYVIFLLNKLQDVLAGGALRATGILALFYCAVLFTEGIGVYMQKRWAEFLMIFATGALIPLEMRHVWHRLIFHRPIFAPILLLLANCFIVWFLYLVLRRDKLEKQTAPEPELIETR